MQVKAETAELFAKWGWPVVPVPFGPLRPSDIEALFELASDDPSVARSLFEAAPHNDIGVPLGQRSRTFVIRVEGQSGIEALGAVQGRGRVPSSICLRSSPTTEDIWFQIPLGYGVASQNLGEGLDVLGEGEIVVAAPLAGPKAGAWIFPPDICELDWPPRWLLKLVGARLPGTDSKNDGSALAMCTALEDAAFSEGAIREDKLLHAASAIANAIKVGRLSIADGYNELLRASEHNGLSREPRWARFKPLLMARLRATDTKPRNPKK